MSIIDGVRSIRRETASRQQLCQGCRAFIARGDVVWVEEWPHYLPGTGVMQRWFRCDPCGSSRARVVYGIVLDVDPEVVEAFDVDRWDREQRYGAAS